MTSISDIPKKMRAVAISKNGGPDVLELVTTDVPEIKDNEVLVRVRAAGVNRPDVFQRQGNYPPPPGASPLPGLEVAGTVVKIGRAVSQWKEGDKVTALIAGGGYAEYAAVASDNILPLPDGFDFIEAAALPETFFTVWSNVFDRGHLKAGEFFLVHGGTSGIGTTAIQLAKVFGAKVIATAGSQKKCAVCRKLGADLAINYHSEDFVAKAFEFSNKHGVDVILDMVGGEYTNRNYKLAAADGRIVQIANLSGNLATVNLNYIFVKRLIHTGSTLRARDTNFKAAIAEKLKQKVWPLLAAKKVFPVIDKIFPLAEAAKAHERMESGAHIGKIILKID
ncbi:NAD(P)H-quinone oxidoreductase [uncultured Bartonella sp.]|uniref:NAD(P)H-quinone oxidoreductase n=1 Tax=uncultured Bartonella sp. TaxID=104108 RepID=UPI0026142E07|nr:NAD(P)H-quinone oxidoreductase [uncultured Bartonella sp.]